MADYTANYGQHTDMGGMNATTIQDNTGLREMQLEDQMRAMSAQRARDAWFQSQTNIPSAQAQDRIAEMQAKAQFDAAQFEKRYTDKQKMDIAKWNMVKQNIANNTNFSDTEKVAVNRMADLNLMGIKPADLPKTTPEFNGHKLGDTWQDEMTGGIVTMRQPGQVHVLVRPDQTVQYMQQKQDSVNQQKTLDLQTKHEQKLLDLRMKLATEDIVEPGPGGVPSRRNRKPEEVNAIMQTILNSGQQPQTGQQGQPAQQEPWWQRASKQGLKVTSNDQALPEQVGYAASFYRTMRSKYGGINDVPPDKRAAYQQAASILSQYATKQQAGQ